MTAIVQFIAQVGKSFTAQQYDPADNSALGTGISVGSDNPPGFYSFSTSRTGIVMIVASATNLKVCGYANLDEPINGKCPIVDTYAEAADIAATKKLIKAKTDLIGSASATVQSPVTEDGEIPILVIGDAYTAANGRQIDIFIAKPAGVTTSQCSCKFGGALQHKGSWLVTGTVTDASNNRLRMRFEMVQADWGTCKPACGYKWTATLIAPGRITPLHGEVELIETQTL